MDMGDMEHAPLTKDDPRYIRGCSACEEAVSQGLEFAETHATTRPGYLDCGGYFTPSPHCNDPDCSFQDYSFTPLNLLNEDQLKEVLGEYSEFFSTFSEATDFTSTRFNLIDSIFAEKYRKYNEMSKQGLVQNLTQWVKAFLGEVDHMKGLSVHSFMYNEMTETELVLRLIIFSELALSATANINNYINREAIDE